MLPRAPMRRSCPKLKIRQRHLQRGCHHVVQRLMATEPLKPERSQIPAEIADVVQRLMATEPLKLGALRNIFSRPVAVVQRLMATEPLKLRRLNADAFAVEHVVQRLMATEP